MKPIYILLILISFTSCQKHLPKKSNVIRFNDYTGKIFRPGSKSNFLDDSEFKSFLRQHKYTRIDSIHITVLYTKSPINRAGRRGGYEAGISIERAKSIIKDFGRGKATIEIIPNPKPNQIKDILPMNSKSQQRQIIIELILTKMNTDTFKHPIYAINKN